jgi:phosphoenolpyruvate carboxylase
LNVFARRKEADDEVEADSSFDETYEVIFPLIYRFVSIRVPKPDVEDVSAEIIVKVWRGLPDIEKKMLLKLGRLRLRPIRLSIITGHISALPP